MKNRITLFFVLLMISTSIYAQKVMRIGIIGLDTSHSTAFTELINSGSDETFSKGFRVVAAYPYGSKTIQSSYERIPGYIEKVKAQGVEITSSIADLLEKVDCVLLETNDGRLHLEQAMEVFKAGKICYIDKPIGATLEDAIAIYEMAEKYNIPIFSSSALRFTPQNQKLRNSELGQILGADCYSPHKVEPTHPDFGHGYGMRIRQSHVFRQRGYCSGTLEGWKNRHIPRNHQRTANLRRDSLYLERRNSRWRISGI